MQEQDHSYLDLSVLPELRAQVLSPHAVVVFRKDLQAILWANANGAKLFGGRGVADLLRAKLSEEQTIIRQLRKSISKLKKRKPLTRGFRINQSSRSSLLQLEIRRIELPNDDQAFMVTNFADEDIVVSENQLAEIAVASLEGFADAAAILDDNGSPIAASPEFTALSPDEDILSGLSEELKNEDDRLIKRALPNAAGNTMALGIARLSENPARNLIVLADTDEPAEMDNQPSAALVVDSNVGVEIDPLAEDEEAFGDEGDFLEDDAEDVVSTESIIAAGTNAPDTQNLLQADDTIKLPEEALTKPADADGSLSENESSETSDNSSNEIKTYDFDDLPDPDELDDEISDEDFEKELAAGNSENASANDAPDDCSNKIGSNPQVDGDFLYFDEKDDVRFAWTIDRHSIFQSVSPELSRTVGPKAAEIVGRSWEDISKLYGFDSTGEIAKKFSNQDTWSGKCVLWPVQGTDMVVPVDLAALPAFGSDRSFEGFKGFGIIRTIDAIVDPEATGMALVSPDEDVNLPSQSADLEDNAEDDPEIFWDANASDDSHVEPENDIQSLFDKAQKGLSDSDKGVADDDDTNVVRLVPKGGHPAPTLLSDKENSAFKVIGETLRGSDDGNLDSNEKQPDDAKHLDTSLMENLPVAILVYRTDELLFANQRLFQATGYEDLASLKDAGGVDAILDPDDIDEDGSAKQFLATRNGNRIPIEPVLHTVPWLGEKALLLSFSMADDVIIDEPLAIEISTSSEIQNILDTASDGIVLMEPDGKIVSINASAEALFGKSFDETAGKPFAELFAPESHETVAQYLETLSDPGVERLLNDGRDVIAQEKNGGLIPIFLTVSQMDTSNKLCAVIRDMTSWKKVEEELIQSRREAVKASEQKTDFLAHVSHEIRTPLNAIIGFSDVMLEEKFGPIENQRYRDYLRDINRSGSHVLELVNDLLDLSKIEAGKLELSFEAVELNQIVAETVALLQPQANSNRIIIRTSLSRAVPKVVADPRSIRQIILNLVSNAIKFSPANSQVIVSTIYESNGEVAMRVRDTGHGMSDAEIEEALKPFHQLHHVSERAGEGTGLGLPLTKALVEANRALFDIESTPGTGTIAHVQFPTQRVLAD